MNGFGRKQCARRILAALIACMLLAGMGSALAVGLVERDCTKYTQEFCSLYAGYTPIVDGATGTGPKNGEFMRIGDLELSRGGESYYVGNCNEWVSLREEASTSSARIRKVYYGEEVYVLGTWRNWALVWDISDDRYGWILWDYLCANMPGDAYDAGCDYDLEVEGDYWYNSTELFDFIGNPISPAVAYLGLSYSDLVSVGGDGLMCKCYTNGSFDLTGDDEHGILIVEMKQPFSGYTLGGASVGMNTTEAYNRTLSYFAENASSFLGYECGDYGDTFFVSFDTASYLSGWLQLSCSNNRVTEIFLFVL